MHVTRRNLIQGAVVTAGATLAHAAAPAQVRESGPTETERAAMARLASEFMAMYDVPGLSVAIAMAGQLAYADSFGMADRETREVLTPEHLFRIASVTKTITSATIMLLIQSGRFRLDSKVFGKGSILGADYATPPGRESIELVAVEHLLTHTAGGWSNEANDPMFLNPQMDHQELIAWTLRNQPQTAMPGQTFAYSNFGYCILGRVIEKVTGRPYDQHVSEAVLRPCGISAMRIAGNTLADRAPNEVRYYDQAGENPYRMNVRRMDSHGGWIATPSEIATFATYIDGSPDRAQLLMPDTLKAMRTPSAANPLYAKGLMVNSRDNWWHTGSLPGTETIMVRTHGDFCWAAFTNARSNSSEMSPALDQLVWQMAGKVAVWHP